MGQSTNRRVDVGIFVEQIKHLRTYDNKHGPDRINMDPTE